MARINLRKLQLDLQIKQKRCFYQFMREAYGFDDDVYPSDVGVDWVWNSIGPNGERLCSDDLSAVGIDITAWPGPHSMRILFSELSNE